jgi:hypothetical protein
VKERRLYSIEEANALLAHLAPALVELREKYERAQEARREIQVAAAGNGGSHEREELNRLVARVDELLERLAEWDVELRDVSTGLVDFPSIVEGGDAFLCWRLGEPEVAWWHRPDEGFRGRQPL